MLILSKAHRSAMQGLLSFFQPKWFSGKSQRSAEVLCQQNKLSEQLRRNHAKIGGALEEIRAIRHLLKTALAGKKVNRSLLSDHLDDLVFYANMLESHLKDRTRIEKRYGDLGCGYPATCPSKKGCKNRGK